MLLWLWHSPAAAALLQPLDWELSYATGAALKRQQQQQQQPPPPIITVMWLIALLYLLPVSVAGELDTALDLSSFCGDTTEIYQ